MGWYLLEVEVGEGWWSLGRVVRVGKGWSGVRRLVNGSGGKMPDVEHSFMSYMCTLTYLVRQLLPSTDLSSICSCGENHFCGMPQTQILESPSDGQHLQTKGDITMS